MRFIHIADIHLGAVPDSDMPWSKMREREIWESFRNIISLCNEQEIDLLLIAGDLFHRQPLVRELKEVKYYFSLLKNTQVVFMAGNHDYISARSNYIDFPWDMHVHMLSGASPERIELDGLNTEVYGLSYHTRDITEPRYDNMEPEANKKIHILLAHGGDEKDIPINRKKIMTSGFHYVALGHIHKPEIMSNRMAYSGSLEPLDRTEKGPRGYILGEITPEENYRTSINFIPVSQREYHQIELNIDRNTTNGALRDQIREAILQNGEQHIYTLYIQGKREESMQFDRTALMTLGNIIEVQDNSIPDYDFDSLYHENEDNLIGYFIRRIQESGRQDQVADKALYYGLEALLEAKER